MKITLLFSRNLCRSLQFSLLCLAITLCKCPTYAICNILEQCNISTHLHELWCCNTGESTISCVINLLQTYPRAHTEVNDNTPSQDLPE